MKTIIEHIIRRRFWVIFFIVLATVFFAAQIRNLKIVIDPTALLPKQHPNVIGTNLAEALFGSKYVVVVGVSAADSGTAMKPEVLQVVADLSRDLARVPGVKAHTLLSVAADKAKAISGTETEMKVEPLLDKKIDGAAIANLIQRLGQNPIYQDTLVSKDKSVVSIAFSIDIGPKGFREVMDKVQTVIDKTQTTSVKVTQSGTAVFFANVERFSQRMVFLFPIALVLIGLIHLEAFRTVQGLLLPLVTAILAVIWGLGIMGAAHVSMDAFNATTPILILAVAAGHAVQILKRYYEEYERISAAQPRHPTYALNDMAIVESMTKVAPVMVAAGLVAALGFFSLVTFQIATIRTFGIFTGLGILSALLIELTFIPALRSYLPSPKLPGQKLQGAAHAGPRLWDRIAKQLTQLVINRYRSIIASFMVLAVIAVAAMSGINRENSTKSYFGESLTVRQDDRFLNAKLAGTNTLYVVFQGNRTDHMKDPGVLRVIEEAQQFIAQLPEVGKTMSIVDLIKQMNSAMHSGAADFRTVPPSQELISQYLLLYSMSGQPTDFDSYIDYNYRNANLIVWMKNDSSKYAETVVSKIRQHLEPRLPPGVTITIGGSVPQTSALSETLVDGKMLNIAQMMGIVFVAGALVFRSLLAGFYLILPLVFTVLVNFGTMGLTGIPLNTPNSVSSAMAIGIGADYAIYLLYRIREELRKGGDIDVALAKSLKTAGKAIVYVASAIVGGYSVLILSFNFYVHIWFGILIVLSMIVSAVSALLLIPALIKAYPPRFLSRNDLRTTDLALPLKVTSGAVLRSLFLGSSMLVGAALLVGVSQPVVAQDTHAAELMEKNYQATRVDSSISEASFKLVNAAGQERVRKILSVTKLQPEGQSNRRVIRFLSPSDVRNTTTLLLESAGKEDEIWVYLPALKKARRLSSSNKKNSFVGTDLSYGDIVGHKAQDWTHKITKLDRLTNTEVFVVESVPKNLDVANDAGYSKRITWVARDSFLGLKVEFYDLSGALLKTLDNANFKVVDAKLKKFQPMLVNVKNHQTGHATILSLERFEANIPIAESYFTAGYLEKEE